MPDPIEIPEALLRAVKITWTAENNHALSESPFSGITQGHRGRIERWSFTMDIKRMKRREAQEAMAFFLQLEGPLGTFRMHDPSACKPLGKATGNPTIVAGPPVGSRTILSTGWLPNVTRQLVAGDWIQIGEQLFKVRRDVSSDADGNAMLDLWPKTMTLLPSWSPIITRPARGIFRFTSELPSWDIAASDLNSPYTFRLTGVQEVLSL